MTKIEQAELLDRARNGVTMSNYPAIFDGFMAKGIAETDIKPRDNVFTFNAWKALGRSVKKGEHGVKVVTFIECDTKERDPATGAETRRTYRKPHTTTVFHISQTEAESDRQSRKASEPVRSVQEITQKPCRDGKSKTACKYRTCIIRLPSRMMASLIAYGANRTRHRSL